MKEDSPCFKCMLCLPCKSFITAYKNSLSNLRKYFINICRYICLITDKSVRLTQQIAMSWPWDLLRYDQTKVFTKENAQRIIRPNAFLLNAVPSSGQTLHYFVLSQNGVHLPLVKRIRRLSPINMSYFKTFYHPVLWAAIVRFELGSDDSYSR